jgi:hypothetical protein
MAKGISRAFLPIVRGVEILFSASLFFCYFEMAEGLSTTFFPSGVSPGAITEVFGPYVPAAFFDMSSADLSRAFFPSCVLPGAIREVLGPDVPAASLEMSSADLSRAFCLVVFHQELLQRYWAQMYL